MFPEMISIRVPALAVAGVLSFALTALANNAPAGAGTDASLSELRLPLSFELNRGQTEPEIKALSRGNGYGLLLTDNEAVLVLTLGTKKQQTTLRFKTLGSNPAPAISGLEALPGTVSYFVGNDPSKWRSGISTYAKIKYESVYPGIDLVYYGNQQELEYDFVVAPGADPSAIRFEVSGARKVRLAENGDLALETNQGYDFSPEAFPLPGYRGTAARRGRPLRTSQPEPSVV